MLGVETVEIGLGGAHGGWSLAPHADLHELLTDPAARSTLRRDTASRGLRLEAFNAAGNPLHPVDGARDDAVLRGALQLAEEFEVDTVVTMSGLPANPGERSPPGSPPSGRRRTCGSSSTSGPSPSTTGATSPPRRAGAASASPWRCTPTSSSTAFPACSGSARPSATPWAPTSTPATCCGWVRDPIAATGALAGAIHHVHAKDTRIESRAVVASRLETVPNERTDERAWNYVAVGTGHPDGVAFWTRFVDTLRDAGYDGPLSIENEDYTLGQHESVALAVETLRTALGAVDPGRIT